MNVILFGAPGAGKGTQAVRIAKEYKIVHISTGEMFRQAMAEHTPMGDKAAFYINQGNLVPDDITIGIVKERLEKEDCKNGFILDGFPRTLYQAEALAQIFQELNMTLDHVIVIDVDTEELLKRLTGRRMCKSCGASYHLMFQPPKVENKCDTCNGDLYVRADDNMESVKVRLENYQKQTKPLLAYYEGKDVIRNIDGQKEIDEVFAEIVKKVGK